MTDVFTKSCEMYRFIDNYLDEEYATYSVEGQEVDDAFVVRLVEDGDVDNQHELILDVVPRGSFTDREWEERRSNELTEWMACLRWLSTVTACVIKDDVRMLTKDAIGRIRDLLDKNVMPREVYDGILDELQVLDELHGIE